MILSDQQFEEIRQECPCYSGDVGNYCSTTDMNCVMKNCPFLYWFNVKKYGATEFIRAWQPEISEKEQLKIQSDKMEVVGKPGDFVEVTPKESQWAFTDDRRNPPVHYTKEYLLNILDIYHEKNRKADPSLDTTQKLQEAEVTIHKLREDIRTIMGSHEATLAENRQLQSIKHQLEENVKSLEKFVNELKENLVKKDKKIQSLQNRINEINEQTRKVFSLSNVPPDGYNLFAPGGTSAGANMPPSYGGVGLFKKQEADPNTNEAPDDRCIGAASDKEIFHQPV